MQEKALGPTEFIVEMSNVLGNTSQVAALRKILKSNSTPSNKLANAGPIVMNLLTHTSSSTNKFSKVFTAWSRHRRWLELAKKRNRRGTKQTQPQARTRSQKRKLAESHAFGGLPENVMRTHIHPKLNARNILGLSLASKRHHTNARKAPKVGIEKSVTAAVNGAAHKLKAGITRSIFSAMFNADHPLGQNHTIYVDATKHFPTLWLRVRRNAMDVVNVTAVWGRHNNVRVALLQSPNAVAVYAIHGQPTPQGMVALLGDPEVDDGEAMFGEPLQEGPFPAIMFSLVSRIFKRASQLYNQRPLVFPHQNNNGNIWN